MTLEACTALLAPLAIAMRAGLDVPTFTAYHRVLGDIPLSVLEGAVTLVERDPGRKFFPTVQELRTFAEQYRLEMLALHPWNGCADCIEQKGWRPITRADGLAGVERCPCLAHHHAHLEGLGLRRVITPLPPAREEPEPVFMPAKPFERLHPEVSAALRAIAERSTFPRTSPMAYAPDPE